VTNAGRYEINHESIIVKHESALCSDQGKIIHDVFSQFGWSCEELNRTGSCRQLQLTHANGDSKIITVFSGSVRNESRNPYEKKIQLGSNVDPNSKDKSGTIILGIYVFNANDTYKDAIFVGYPIDERIRYQTNPSLRGVFVNKLLINAKKDGFVYDKVHNTVGFRAEFIYYYLKNFYNIHYKQEAIPQMDDSTSSENLSKIMFKTGFESEFYRNRILFGAPGTGKSFTLNRERRRLLGDENECDYERVTFHPDYSYANFVGTYKPVPCKDSDDKDTITYEYVPGPFMRIYVKALKNGRTYDVRPFLLIVEEINRANVAAVFGDVFQLLDRDDDEVSEYPIQASEDIKKYLARELGGEAEQYSKIKIPDNMFIWATMNSADQGVFPMDTAFKRRWDFTYLGIDDSESGIAGKIVSIGEGDNQRNVEWNELRKAINDRLAGLNVNEDKLLGPYFLSKKAVFTGDEIDPQKFKNTFKNKVLMYLFEDAAKQKKSNLFSEGVNTAKYSSVCREFDKKGIFVFCSEISNRFPAAVTPENAKGEN